jgi:amino acid permease
MSELKSLESEKHYPVDSVIGAAEADVEYGVEQKTTHRHLKPRHVQLIAISGAIGTGLFVSEKISVWITAHARSVREVH